VSKLRVSFEYLFAGPSVLLVFGNQNMVTLLYGHDTSFRLRLIHFTFGVKEPLHFQK